MPRRDLNEPPRWRQLCAELQNEQDPVKFQALLEEIELVLAEFEGKSERKADPKPQPGKPPTQPESEP